LYEHWRNVVDEQQMLEVRWRLQANRVTLAALMTALVCRYPIRLRPFLIWLKLLGYDESKPVIKAAVLSCENALVLDDQGRVTLDQVRLAVEIMTKKKRKDYFRGNKDKAINERRKFNLRWVKGMDGVQGDDPYHYRDNYRVEMSEGSCRPSPSLIALLAAHPYVEINECEPFVGWCVGNYDSTLERSCCHGQQCDVCCVGGLRSESLGKGVFRILMSIVRKVKKKTPMLKHIFRNQGSHLSYYMSCMVIGEPMCLHRACKCYVQVIGKTELEGFDSQFLLSFPDRELSVRQLLGDVALFESGQGGEVLTFEGDDWVKLSDRALHSFFETLDYGPSQLIGADIGWD